MAVKQTIDLQSFNLFGFAHLYNQANRNSIKIFYDKRKLEIVALGGYSQNFLRQILKIFVTLGLNILRFYRLKVFLQQILVKFDVVYNKSDKIPIFNV